MSSLLRNATTARTRAVRNVTDTLSNVRHIELENVPASATPADLRRFLRRYDAQGVSDAAIIYENFLSTRRALLTLSRPNFLQDNLRSLQNAFLGGLPITAKAKEIKDDENESLLGSGPHGSMPGNGKNVVLWNIPPTVNTGAIDFLVSDYALAGPPADSIVKLQTLDNTKPDSYLVKCESQSEAHRLVRNIHMTRLNEARWPSLFIRARVVY